MLENEMSEKLNETEHPCLNEQLQSEDFEMFPMCTLWRHSVIMQTNSIIKPLITIKITIKPINQALIG